MSSTKAKPLLTTKQVKHRLRKAADILESQYDLARNTLLRAGKGKRRCGVCAAGAIALACGASPRSINDKPTLLGVLHEFEKPLSPAQERAVREADYVCDQAEVQMRKDVEAKVGHPNGGWSDTTYLGLWSEADHADSAIMGYSDRHAKKQVVKRLRQIAEAL